MAARAWRVVGLPLAVVPRRIEGALLTVGVRQPERARQQRRLRRVVAGRWAVPEAAPAAERTRRPVGTRRAVTGRVARAELVPGPEALLPAVTVRRTVAILLAIADRKSVV